VRFRAVCWLGAREWSSTRLRSFGKSKKIGRWAIAMRWNFQMARSCS